MIVTEKNYDWAYALTAREITTHLILHHAAAQDATAEGIHTYHLSLGWAGIAYHYFVTKQGQIFRGRPENMRGGHTTNWNYCAIGICFEGNFELEEMSKAQINAGRQLVADIVSRYPSIVVGKHSAYGPTACPGSNFPFDRIVGGNAEPSDESAEKKTQPDAWASAAAAWAIDAGLFIGDENGDFRWHEGVTRQELALILMRYENAARKNELT